MATGLRRLWRYLSAVLRYRLIPDATSPLRHLRSPRQLLSAWPEGTITLGPKVALFVHFDRGAQVRPHVLHYIRSLRDAGFDVVVVSNSGRLRPEAMAALQPLCAAILMRRNVGYDFGAWREAIDHLALPRPGTEMVALANDSVYGPLRPLDEMLDRIDFESADVWGPTESWQSRYHLQSYFLIFGRRALESAAWQHFWPDVLPAPSKYWVIRHYEVGLSQAMIRAGLHCRALWPYAQLVAAVDPELLSENGEDARRAVDPIVKERRRHAGVIRGAAARRQPLNPTSDLWRQLLQDGFPFIKRELLRDNPSEVADVADWQEVVGSDVTMDLETIVFDLQRTLRNRAP
jgi:Rhamnan synthesis protein F